jgi:AAA+ superfamily predicted ATPase
MAGPGDVDIKKLLTPVLQYPDEQAAARFSRLVGVETRAEQLVADLHLIFNPTLANSWSKKHHKRELKLLLGLLEDMVPLLIFEGDVGTGKTALAETIGDVVARAHSYNVAMVKMSTQVRGTGYVGEMGTMLATAFERVVQLWQKSSLPLILVIDEADSILTSRASAHQHHEDKSGVNTVLQHLDGLKAGHTQVAVIAITNRVGVLDPALMRRATAVYTFERPTRSEREALLTRLLAEAKLPNGSIARLVQASEPKSSGGECAAIPFSWSDLTIRFVVPAIRDAIRRDEPLRADELVGRLERLPPSPILST